MPMSTPSPALAEPPPPVTALPKNLQYLVFERLVTHMEAQYDP
jgi:hypothetical protein